MSTSTAAQNTAETIFAAVSAGQSLFTKSPSGTWLVIGPSATIRTGTMVEVTKADATTKWVHVTAVTTTATKRGLDYSVATFTDGWDPNAARATTAAGYRTVRSAVYGIGRIYHDEPGATYYDDGTGRFGIQIWDN